MKNLGDVLKELERMKAKWVDPEEIDDGEDLIIEAVQFIEEATPIVRNAVEIVDRAIVKADEIVVELKKRGV